MWSERGRIDRYMPEQKFRNSNFLIEKGFIYGINLNVHVKHILF